MREHDQFYLVDPHTTDEAKYHIFNLSNNEEIDLGELSKDQNNSVFLTNDRKQVTKQLWQQDAPIIISSNSDDQTIHNALNMLASRRRYYCPDTLDIINSSIGEPAIELSTREQQVLSLIAQGKPTDDIANQLYVSVHTINSHRKNLMKKLNFQSPVELIVYAVKEFS